MNILLPLIVCSALGATEPTPPPEPPKLGEPVEPADPVAKSDAGAPETAPEETPEDASKVVEHWMVYQYLLGGGEKAPEMTTRFLDASLKDIEDEDDRAHALTLMNIFLAQVGKAHPELLDAWTTAATAMVPDAQTLFAYAVWIADPAGSAPRIARIVDAMPKDDERRDMLSALPEQEPPNFKAFKPSDGAVLDYWWASFMATGDTEYIGCILTALPPRGVTYDDFDPGDDYMALAVAASATWSLTSNAFQHPVVLGYLKEQRAAEPGPWPVLDKIIANAEKKLADSPSPAPTPLLAPAAEPRP